MDPFWWRRARCAEPQNRALFDDANERPGDANPAAQKAKRICRHECPVAAECLDEAMRTGDHGVRGGTSPNWRIRHGAPSRRHGPLVPS